LKSDLRDDQTTVDKLKSQRLSPISFGDGAALAESLGCADYMECSALTGEGVNEILTRAVEIVIDGFGGLARRRKRRAVKDCLLL
jgi:GTPase SAR1 family protein